MSDTTIVCDTSTGRTLSFCRSQVPLHIDSLHSWYIQVTRHLVTAHYVWPGINADVRKWARSCQQCQQCQQFKVQQHTVTLLSTFATNPRCSIWQHPPWYFVTPISLLALINWHAGLKLSLLLTSQQRQLKLLQAAGSQNLVFHLLPQLIEDISLNQELRKQLMQLLGSNQVRATAYHPIANGLNESFQHLLKASLKSHLNQTHWIDFLTKVLLGICTALKDNIKLQYGRTDVRHYFTSTW